MRVTVRRFATPDGLAAEAGAQFGAAAGRAVAARGRFLVALPGGRTPAVLYRVLRAPPLAGSIAWDRCHVFFSDERCVPAEDAASNYGLARRELLAHVPVPPAQVHRAPVEAGAAPAVAAAWEQALRRFFAAGAAHPGFDLAVLGVGSDGHTASLFPGAPELEEQERWVVPVAARGSPPVARVTLTLAVLRNARSALFLAAGPDKQQVIDAVESARPEAWEAYPAARVRPQGGALWLYSEAQL